MRTIIENESVGYSSKTIEHNNKKFKIATTNGNCYSHLIIEVYRKDGGLEKIAFEYDIPNYKRVDYIDSDERRLEGQRANIKAAEDYINILDY